MSEGKTLRIIELPPTPRDIFRRFLEGLPKSNIKMYGSSEPWTKYVTEFFRKWGEDLGYEVHCKEKYGGKKEYMSLDLVWIKKAVDQRFIDLAMEHENDVTNAFEKELQKLMDVKALLKVLITYITDKKERADFVARVAWAIRMRALRLPEECYTLILGSCPEGKKKREPYVKLYGYVFDNTGRMIKRFTSSNICTCSGLKAAS